MICTAADSLGGSKIERVYDYVLELCPAGVGRNTFAFSMGSSTILLLISVDLLINRIC